MRNRLAIVNLLLAIASVVSQPCKDISTAYFTFPYLVDDPYGVGIYQYDTFLPQPLISQPQFPPQYSSQLTKLTAHVQYFTNFTFCATNTETTNSGHIDETIAAQFQFYLPGQDTNGAAAFTYDYIPDTSRIQFTTPEISPGQTVCIDPIHQSAAFALLPRGTVDFDVPSQYWPNFFGSGSMTPSVGNTYNPAYTATLGNFIRIDHWWFAVNVSFTPIFSGLNIVKKTNLVHYASAPGAAVIVPNTVSWQYEVTNSGTAPVSALTVTDSQGVQVGCPKTTLGVCETVVCSGSGPSTSGAYSNTASSTAVLNGSPINSNTDVSFYFGYSPKISLDKFTNDINTNVAAVPNLPQGSSVTWKYVITNNGNCPLTGVAVTDNKVATVTCPSTLLAVGSSVVCSATGTALPGVYTNVGSAQGDCDSATGAGAHVVATSPSSYFAFTQSIAVVKTTNGVNTNNNALSGPNILAGNPVTWSFTVTNTGSSDLSNVGVNDNKAGSATCPSTILSAGSSMVCTAVGVATIGSYSNTGTAHGVSPLGATSGGSVSATSSSQYFGVLQSISLVKLTNDVDIRNTAGTGPQVLLGSSVTWKYVVTNTGNSPLSGVVVSDNHGVSVSCPSSNLGSGGSIVCSATGQAISGSYTNVGSARGTSVVNQQVSSTSPSNYFGVAPSISLRKSTNGVDTRASEIPTIVQGNPVTWSYEVTNNGNGDLTSITVSDNRFDTPLVCSADTLAVGAWVTCYVTGMASVSSYTNVGTAVGQWGSTSPATVTSTCPSSYLGVNLGISIIKFVNGLHPDAINDSPLLVVGKPVTWKYVVTNTGTQTLSNVQLVDGLIGALTCPTTPTLFQSGSSFTCLKTGVVEIGPITAPVGVTANGFSTSVSDDDVVYYQTFSPMIQLIKRTNGVIATESDYPRLRTGTPVTWTYEVTNTGSIIVSSVIITDDKEPVITCPSDPITLAPQESVICSATGVALECRYRNNACANTRGASSCVESNYLGLQPAISIVKFTNDLDYASSHNSQSPPCISLDKSQVTWTYVVSNIGEDLLYNVHVVDDQLAIPPYCPRNQLGAWDSMTCTAIDAAILGPYTNIASAWGSPSVGGADVIASDQNWYTGIAADINVKIFVNGRRTLQVFDEGDSAGGEGKYNRIDGNHGEGRQDGGDKHNDGGDKHDGGGEGDHGSPRWSSQSASAVLPRANRRSLKELDGIDAFAQAAQEHAPPPEDPEGQGECDSGPHPGRDHGEGEGRSSRSRKSEHKGERRIRWRGPVIALEEDLEFTFVVENFGSTEVTGIQLSFPDASASTGIIPYVSWKASDVSCPANSLGIGEVMTCVVLTTGDTVKSVGQQALAVAAQADAPCNGAPLQANDRAYWWNQKRSYGGQRPDPNSGAGQGGDGVVIGEGSHAKKIKGCNVEFWRHTRNFNAYPSTLNGQAATITPQTSYQNAAALSTDPTGREANILAVLWTAADDDLSAFFQHSAVALLNSASNDDFNPRYGSVVTAISQALTAYNNGSPALLKLYTREWTETEGWC